MLAGDLGRRTGRSQSYPRSSLGVPRQVLTHGAVTLTFRGGEIFGSPPLSKNETVKVYILLARNTLTRSQGVPKKVRGASGRASGRGGSLEPATLRAENPGGGSDPLAVRRCI